MRTLSEALDSLARKGYTQHFGVVHSTLRDYETGKVFGPDQAFIREYERFEGISDPDDMSIVWWGSCSVTSCRAPCVARVA